MMVSPVAPNHPISITLEAQEWNIVLGVLSEGPYKTVAPLMGKIMEQAQRATLEPELRVVGGEDVSDSKPAKK